VPGQQIRHLIPIKKGQGRILLTIILKITGKKNCDENTDYKVRQVVSQVHY
jgi:hypothetical protein